MAAIDQSLEEELLAKTGDGSVPQEKQGGASLDELKASLASVTEMWRTKVQGYRKKRKEAEEADMRAPWRRTLGEILDATPVHAFILTLLLLDLLATVVDVLHTLSNDSRDLSDCVTYLESCQCTSHFETSESWEFLYWIGIFVLCVLALNIVGLLVAQGLAFFTHAGNLLDLLVVVTALCLEIFLDTETASFLLILNLWRLVRVAHGIFGVTDETMEKEMRKLEMQVQGVEVARQQDQQLLRDKEARILQLQRQLEAAISTSSRQDDDYTS